MDRSIRDQSVKKILIRCPNWVGDVVMATPALKAIRSGFPDAHITWLVRPLLKKIIETLPYWNQIFEYGGGDRFLKVGRLLSWSMRLRREEFDMAVVLPNSFSSALMVFLAGIRHRVGYSREGRGLMLTDSLMPVREGSTIVPVPMVDYYLRISDSLKCPRLTTVPELSVSRTARQQAEVIFKRLGVDTKRHIVVIIPGAAFGSSKCWKPEYFAQVADHLIERYACNVIIVPGPEEVEIVKDIEARMEKRAFALIDPIVPLDVLMAIIQSSSLLITNDTGPRHFGVAFNKPVVVIMGPTDPRYTNLNLEKTIVLRENLDCSPCHLKVCPRDHRCMTAITPDRVIQASVRFLEESLEQLG